MAEKAEKLKTGTVRDDLGDAPRLQTSSPAWLRWLTWSPTHLPEYLLQHLSWKIEDDFSVFDNNLGVGVGSSVGSEDLIFKWPTTKAT